MTKFKLIIISTSFILFLNGCSQVLESVVITNKTKDVNTESIQEEFDITVKSLTFKSARKANNDPYPRQLMLNGIGTKANVFDEVKLLKPKIPPSLPATDYIIGIGDQLRFAQLNEFSELLTEPPAQDNETEYLLGEGDELTLVQISGSENLLSVYSRGGKRNTDQNVKLLETSSIVGTNGNILLLGLGNIKAANRPLSSIQTEVRNIFIRNGFAPNFQLEISGFNSQKAYVSSVIKGNNFDNSVPITNLPITLKEVLINLGLQFSKREKIFVTLNRNGKHFRMTGGQIYNGSIAEILIKDKDQIKIDYINEALTSHEALVGSNGFILLPNIGSFKAANLSLTKLKEDITNELLSQGMIPDFQLEISNYKSKNYFVVSKNANSSVVPLTSSNLSLKDAVLSNGIPITNNNSLRLISLTRDDSSYRMTIEDILNVHGSKIKIQDGDIIEFQEFNYKPGKVFALSGAGNAQLVTIDPSIRETLADILFTPSGALNNLLAKRSEVYLLRGQNPSTAYHLDAQNVSRILVAAETELRPNDIVYVADRPIIALGRTLAEIVPLRKLLNDIKNRNIP